MTARSSPAATALLAIVLAACAPDPSPLAGAWEVTSLEVERPCGAAAEPAEIDPHDRHLRLAEETLFGAPLLAYYECDETGACSDVLSLVRSAAPDGADGWRSALASASGDPCALGYRVRRFSLESDDTLVITVAEHREEAPDLTGAACESRAAAERGETMPCVARSTWRAQRR
jgi:hypothetical protein